MICSSSAPTSLIVGVPVATRVLAAVVVEANPDVRAVVFRRPRVITAPPQDFVPRGATELILHAHDVCTGIGIRFEPPAELCRRLREHTRPWPMRTVARHGLPDTDDPWEDLLDGAGRNRQSDAAS